MEPAGYISTDIAIACGCLPMLADRQCDKGKSARMPRAFIFDHLAQFRVCTFQIRSKLRTIAAWPAIENEINGFAV